MRTGAGLVTLGIPKNLNSAIIKIKPAEVMTLPLEETKEITLSLKAFKKICDFSKQVDVVVIGPGLTQNKSTQTLIRKLIVKIDKPMVIDADGLNALAGQLGLLHRARKNLRQAILTPHPGELARLLGVKVVKIQNKRKETAQKFARNYGLTLVLKGHRTIVADYRKHLFTNTTGNPGMASAGSGDVLSGIIAAFLGQGLMPFAAAKYAVFLHGLAGDLAAKEKTQLAMIASNIIDKIPAAIKICS
jgi:NAD(P)H-hydrate epimerase